MKIFLKIIASLLLITQHNNLYSNFLLFTSEFNNRVKLIPSLSLSISLFQRDIFPIVYEKLKKKKMDMSLKNSIKRISLLSKTFLYLNAFLNKDLNTTVTKSNTSLLLLSFASITTFLEDQIIEKSSSISEKNKQALLSLGRAIRIGVFLKNIIS